MSTALSTKRPAPTLPLSTAASASWRANENPVDGVNTDNSGDSDHHSQTGYSGSHSDETVANQLTLAVVLPDGRKTLIDVDANRSVIDLLIYLCSRTKLNPTEHAIVIPSEFDPRYPSPYTASQTIQSLGASTVHLVRKRPVLRNRAGETSQALPFEVTNRITINLPQNQKHVVRLRPDIILSDLFQMVVEHRGLDPSRHELRHPNQPEVALDPAKPLSSYGVTEVTIVNTASTSSDVSRVQPKLPPSPPKRLHHHVIHVNTGLAEQPVVKSTSVSTVISPPASVTVNGDVSNTATTLQTSPPRQLATEMSEVSASSPPKKRGGFRFQFFTSKKEQKNATSLVSGKDTAAVPASNNVNGSHQSPTVSSNHQSELPQQAPPPRQKRRAPGPPPSVRDSASNLPTQPVTQAVNGDVVGGPKYSTNQLQNSNGNHVAIPSDPPVTSRTVSAATDGTTSDERSKRRAPQPPVPVSAAAQETAQTTQEIAIDPTNAVYVSPKRPKPQRQPRNPPVYEQQQQQDLPTSSSSDSVPEPLYASVRKQHQPSTTAYAASIVVNSSHNDAVAERIEDRQQSDEVTERNSSDLTPRSSATSDEPHVEVIRNGNMTAALEAIADSGQSVQAVNAYSSSVGPPLPLLNGNHSTLNLTNPSTSSSSSSLAKYDKSSELANTFADTGTRSNTRATSSVRSSVDCSGDVIDDDDDDDVTSLPDSIETSPRMPTDAVMTADGVAGPSAVTRIHIGSSGVATVMRDVKTVSVSLPTDGNRQSFQQHFVGSEGEMLSQPRSDVDARTSVIRVAAGESVGVNVVTPPAAAVVPLRRSAAIDDDGVLKSSDDNAGTVIKMTRTAQVTPSNVDLRSNEMATSATFVSQSVPPTSERDVGTSLPLSQQSLHDKSQDKQTSASRNNSVPVANVRNDTSHSPSGPIPMPRSQTKNDNTQTVAPARAVAEPIATATRDVTASTSSSSNNNNNINSYSIGTSSRVYTARGPPSDEGAAKFRQSLSSTTSNSSHGSPSPNSGETNATVAGKETQRRESGRLEIRSAANGSSISTLRDTRHASFPKPEMPPVIESSNYTDKSTSSVSANKESTANNRTNGNSPSSSTAAATTTGFDASNKRVVVRPSTRSLDIDALTELHVRIPSSSSVDCSTYSTNSPAIARVSDVESTSSDASYSPRPKWTKADTDQQNSFSLLNAARKVQPRMPADNEVKSTAIARRPTDVTAKPGTNSFPNTSSQKPAPLTVKPDTYSRLTNDRKPYETTKTVTAEPSNVVVASTINSTPSLQSTVSVDAAKPSTTTPVASTANQSSVSWKDRQLLASGNRVPPASNETGNSKVFAAVSVPNQRPLMQRSKSTSAATPLTSFSAASVDTERNQVETDSVSGGVFYGGVRLKPVQKVSADQDATATAAEQDRRPSTAAAAAAEVDNWRNGLEKRQQNMKPATSAAAEKVNKLEADKVLNNSAMAENGKPVETERTESRSGISVASLGTRTDLNNNSNDDVDKGVSRERMPASVTTQKSANVTGVYGKTQSPSTTAPPTRPTLKSSQSLTSTADCKRPSNTKSGTASTESIQADVAVGRMNVVKDTSVPGFAADDKAKSSSGQFMKRSQSGGQFNALPMGRTAPNATQNEIALQQQVSLKSTNTTGMFDAKGSGAAVDKSLGKPATENDTNTATSAATFGVTLKSRPKTEVSIYARLPAVTELEQSIVSEPTTAPVATEQSPTKHTLRHAKSTSETASDVMHGDSKRSTVNDIRDESTSASGAPLVVLQPPKPRQSRLLTEQPKLTVHEQLMIAIRSAGGSTSTAKSPDGDRLSPLQRDVGGSVWSSNSSMASSDAMNCDEKSRSTGETSGNATSETNSPRVSNSLPIPPPPPPPPPVPPLFNTIPTAADSAQSKPSSSSSKFRLLDPPKLTPREELMLAIRNAGGSAKKKSATSGSVSDVSMSAKKQSHVCVDGASKSCVDRSPRETLSSSSNSVARTSSVSVTDSTTAANGNSLPSVAPPPPPPPAPTPPAAPVVPPGLVNSDVKQTSFSVKRSSTVASGSTAVRNPPALDPREELLAAIRNAGGLRSLKKVSVTGSH